MYGSNTLEMDIKVIFFRTNTINGITKKIKKTFNKGEVLKNPLITNRIHKLKDKKIIEKFHI